MIAVRDFLSISKTNKKAAETSSADKRFECTVES